MMFLSLRYLLARKKQSLLIIVGIMIGTAAYVGISGMMLGFQTVLLDQLVNNDAHIRISAREDLLTSETMGSFPTASHVFWDIPPSGMKDSAKIEYPIGWYQKLNNDPQVLAYSPQVNLNVIFRRGTLSRSGRLIGSDPRLQERVTNIQKYMVIGKFSDMGQTGSRIIIGKALMESLGARPSETLFLTSGSGAPKPFKIVAIFSTGVRNIDESTAFTSLSDAQNLRGSGSEITDIAVKVEDPYNVSEITSSWKLSSREKILSWQEISASILSVFKTQDIVRNSMTISIIVVAGFGIYNILSILVTQKRRDIAILRSMGYLPKDIVSVFFNQGIILGLIGGLVGLFVGHLICRFVGTIEIAPGRMGSDSGHMTISYDVIIYVKAFAIAMLSSVFSSIWPSLEAKKLEPMDIIRSGGQ
ncbi:MAG: ABC transporter permease [Bacteriovoracaceae bacterium]|nr:ABC transporter permease [Bacteriovoracaceae bacterium]